MGFDQLPTIRVVQGRLELLKRGRPTDKNPEGTTVEMPMPWRIVQQEGIPFLVAQAASGGMQYALKLTKGQLCRAIEEIERQEDAIRAEVGRKWGG